MKKSSGFLNFFWPLLGTMQAIAAVKAEAVVPITENKSPTDKGEKSENFVIGIARMADISKESLYFKEIEKKLIQMQKALQGKVVALRKEMDVKVKKLQALGKSNVNVKTLESKQAALQKEIAEKNAIIQAEQNKIQNVQQGHMVEILRQLKLIFKSLGEKHGLTFIIDSDAALYYSKDKTTDITEEAITMLNAVKSDVKNKEAEGISTPSVKE